MKTEVVYSVDLLLRKPTTHYGRSVRWLRIRVCPAVGHHGEPRCEFRVQRCLVDTYDVADGSVGFFDSVAEEGNWFWADLPADLATVTRGMAQMEIRGVVAEEIAHQMFWIGCVSDPVGLAKLTALNAESGEFYAKALTPPGDGT